jgi:hypothetical protein
VRRDLDRVGAQMDLTVVDVPFHAPELAHWISSSNVLQIMGRRTI